MSMETITRFGQQNNDGPVTKLGIIIKRHALGAKALTFSPVAHILLFTHVRRARVLAS